MKTNRSIPRNTVIPVLGYPSVREAVEWLCNTFGFTVRLRIGDHRAQLNVGEGAIVVAEQPPKGSSRSRGHPDDGSSVMVRVEDVDAHHERAKDHGARIVRPPADHPYGERQYTAKDLAGHVWTFTETTADVAPEEWGGEPEHL